jgi:hypothetical protein
VSNKIVLNGIQFELIQYVTKRVMNIQDNVYLTPADNRDDLARRIVAVCEKYDQKNHSMSGHSVSKTILFDVSFIKIG